MRGVVARRLGAALCGSAGLVLLGCLGALTGSSVLPPDVAVISVVPVSTTGFETEARVTLRLSNSNEVPLELDGLRFQLELNGQPFARGRSSDRVTLPRLGDAEVGVLVRTTAADLLRQLGALGQTSELDYSISGDLFMKSPQSRRIPFRDASE